MTSTDALGSSSCHNYNGYGTDLVYLEWFPGLLRNVHVKINVTSQDFSNMAGSNLPANKKLCYEILYNLILESICLSDSSFRSVSINIL